MARDDRKKRGDDSKLFPAACSFSVESDATGPNNASCSRTAP